MQSKILLHTNAQCHHLLLCLLSVVYGFDYPYLFIGTTILLFRLFKYQKVLGGFAVCLIIIYLVARTSVVPFTPVNTLTGRVTDVSAQSVVIRVDNLNYIVYTEETFGIGDIVKITGEAGTIDAPTFPYQFNYQNYLKSQKIHGIIFEDSFEIIAPSQTFSLKARVNQYIDHNFNASKSYIKTFVLADQSDFEESQNVQIKALGIAHLFAISGLHISFITGILYFVTKKIFNQDIITEVIVALFIVIFLVLTSFTPSVMRAGLMVVLLLINKRFNLGYTTIDLLSLLMIALLILNPYAFYQTGFVLTFLVSFVLLLSQSKLKKVTPVEQSFYVSVLAFFITLPIIASMNVSVNILTIILNLVFVPLMMFFVLPMTYLTFFFPFLENLLMLIINVYELIMAIAYRYFLLEVNLFIPPGLLTLLYFLLLYFCITKKQKAKTRSIIAMGVFLLLIHFKAYLNPLSTVTMFDVRGDAFLFQDSFHQCNILIDTGPHDSHNTLALSLRKLGVKRIDYLIITHHHADHDGALEQVLDAVNVDHLIVPGNQENYQAQLIHCGAITLYNYPLEHDHRDHNENSIVTMITMHNERYLMTGDIEVAREQTLISAYDLDADILKAPHHGSITSSTQALIDHVGPHTTLIPAHRNNRFNHPSEKVINRYEENNITIHRLDVEGTIRFRYFFGEKQKKSFNP